VHPPQVERKLAAILSADVVGYSRLMAEDEQGTIRTLTVYRDQIGTLVREHRGRVVDSPGDNLLAEFPTALDAVQAAVEIQRVIGARNADLPAERRMEFRIGVHLGDISVEGERVYGEGVNIAARLEGLAEAGGVCISATVQEQVRHKLDLAYEDLGQQSLKNIFEPVHIYRVGLMLQGTEREDPEKNLPGMDELTVPGFGTRPAIAVLPFDNLSGDPEQEYFADGIAEDLITRLSAWRWFPVIARNSSFVYKGKSVDVKQVSRDLGVRYVVEGSVRKVGDRVRVSAQLIDASTGAHIWAERYDRDLQDIFAVQDEITEVVVGCVAPELERSERDRAARKEPQSLDAWDSFQRGWWHLWKFTKDDNGKATSLFQRAIELEPDFSDALSGLAVSHAQDLVHQWSDSPAQTLAELTRAARRSAELDTSNALGQVALSFVHYFAGQREESIAAAERAIDLNPSLSFAYAFHGFLLALASRPDEALVNAERALRLSPRGPMMFTSFWAAGAAQFSAQRYEEAVEWARRAVRANPKAFFPRGYLVAGYAQLGRFDDARRARRELLQLAPSFSISLVRQNLALADSDFVERFIDGLRKAGLKE
jgi:adenylate cyclase